VVVFGIICSGSVTAFSELLLCIGAGLMNAIKPALEEKKGLIEYHL
jgi:hypothetical protein